MLGYTEDDIYTMMACIKIAKNYIPPNEAGQQITDGLTKAFDFFDGVLAEGHVM